MKLVGQVLISALLILSLFCCSKTAQATVANFFESIDNACLKSVNGQQISSELSEAIFDKQLAYERCMSRMGVVVLSTAWIQNSTLDYVGLQNFYAKLVDNFSKEFLFNLYAMSIDVIYNTEKTELLAGHLQDALIQDNVKSLEATIEAQLYLFWKHYNRHDLNERYLFFAAYYLQKLQNEQLISKVYASLRTRMDAMLAELPSSLRYFFFKPHFCLRNKNSNRFLYTTLVNDFEEGHIKHVFTWEDCSAVGPAGVFEKTEVAHDAESVKHAQTDLKFILNGEDLGFPLYIEKEISKYENLVAAWRDTNTVAPNREWSVKLIDNQLIFSQQGLTMCASNKTHNEQRRFIYASEHKFANCDCQWIAGECN